MEFLTHKEVIELAEKVLFRQRDPKKSDAIHRCIDAYERQARGLENRESWYVIDQHRVCAICGGPILRKVGPGAFITGGGNPIMGCPTCKTIKWDSICRTDIRRKTEE